MKKYNMSSKVLFCVLIFIYLTAFQSLFSQKVVKRPDLIVKNIRIVEDCKIEVTIKNVGTVGVPDSKYTLPDAVAVQMYIGSKAWGGLILKGLDPTGKLKSPGGEVTHIWFPLAANLNLGPGTHAIKVVVDIHNKLTELKEDNNSLTRKLLCKKDNIPPPVVKGWCCYKGKVFSSTKRQCKKKGGRFFSTKEAAIKFCMNKQVKKWEPIKGVTIRNLPLITKFKGASRKSFDTEKLAKMIMRKINPGQIKRIDNPGHDPVPASPGCTPIVFMWPVPMKPDNLYFNDRDLRINYSVDCATSVGIGNLDFYSTDEALALAESGMIGDHGGWGVFYRDAVSAGVLEGSRSYPAGSLRPGIYIWRVGASNGLNPSGVTAEEAFVFQVITRPSIDDSCAAYQDYINGLVRSIAPKIDRGITNNTGLDSRVEAFRDGILDRRVIGLRLKREAERMSTETQIVCTACTSGAAASYSERTPNRITLNFCPDGYPSDYALLHELTHKVGFNSRLIRAYMDAGLWERASSGTPLYNEYRSRVERMTAVVSGAAFD